MSIFSDGGWLRPPRPERAGGNEGPLPERNQVKQMGKRARNKIKSVDKVRNSE